MSTVMELQSKFFPIKFRRGNIMSSSSYFLSTIFSSNDRISTSEKSSPRSARRRESIKELHSAAFFLDPPKWPIECQVLPQKIFHISSVPSKAEPFYVSSGNEPQPRPVGEEMGKVIYDYQPKLSVDYYCRSTTAIETEILQMFDTDENTLRFESRFECGNLSKVIKITNVYYELYLRPDMYTERHSQWYYFRIQNMKEGILYRFSIVNLNKPESLYRYGLKPLMYSEKNAQHNSVGWIRCGKNVSYFKNDLMSEENGSFYTLTFNLKFKYDGDTVYIAQCYPYSYTNLQNYLKVMEMDRFKMTVCQTRLLSRTLGGNNIYILTITSPDAIDDDESKKPVVFLSARVHPGETPSSYMVKEIIDFLTSDCPQAEVLRERFIFKIIPMLNADGVIVGNSRCCLLGQDLNRQYGTVLREAFPQIYQAKVILRRLSEENRLFLYCDIHGHSRKNNAFIYGCENRRMSERKLTEQIFPLMMHKNASDKFSFQSCKFKVQKSKEGTGRLFVWTLGVANSYTLEVSLGGSTLTSRQQTHFTIGDYEGLGRHFCETLLDYSDPLKEQLREKMLQKLIERGSTADEPINVPISDYSSLDHSESENEQSDHEKDDESDEKKNTAAFKMPIRRQPSIKINLKNKTAKHKLKTVLNISKASVEIIRFGRKHKKIDDSINREQENDVLQGTSSIVKSVETNYSSTNKFRRLRRQESILAAMEMKRILPSGASLRKYSKVVFDDPFNTPDPDSSITFQSSQKREKLSISIDAVEMPQSEDECDQTDIEPNGLRNQKLVQQLSYQISSLNITEKHNSRKVGGKLEVAESSQVNAASQILVKINDNDSDNDVKVSARNNTGGGKKHGTIRRSKSQRLDTDSNLKLERTGNNSRQNTLNVPKCSQRRRVSWAGGSSASSTTISPSASISSNIVNKSSSSRRLSVQRMGENTKTSMRTIKKSISMGDSTNTNTNNTNRGRTIIDETKLKVDANIPLNRDTTGTFSTASSSVVFTTKKRKLQNTKKSKSQKKQL